MNDYSRYGPRGKPQGLKHTNRGAPFRSLLNLSKALVDAINTEFLTGLFELEQGRYDLNKAVELTADRSKNLSNKLNIEKWE